MLSCIGSPFSVSPVSRQKSGTVLILLVLFASGCGSRAPSQEDLAAWMEKDHEAVDAFLTFDSIEIADPKPEEGTPDFRVEFQVTEKSKLDVFRPLTLEEAFAELQYDPALFDQAVQKATTLRDPERSGVAGKIPKNQKVSAIYKRTLKAGEKFTWSGTILAKPGESGWEFSDKKGKLDPKVLHPDAKSREELPRNAVLLGAEGNVLTQLIGEQQAFIAAVSEAEKAMQLRLEREHAGLSEAANSRQAFLVSLPSRNRSPAQKLPLRFAHAGSDDETLVVLFEDVNDPLYRGAWKGSLKLADAPQPNPAGVSGLGLNSPRPQPDGWSISLVPVDQANVFPHAFGREIVLGLTAENRLAWLNLQNPALLEGDDKASSLPEYAKYKSQIEAWTSPGQVWEGTVKYPKGISHKVRLTFVDFQDGGKATRVMVEPMDEPQTPPPAASGAAAARPHPTPSNRSARLRSGRSTRRSGSGGGPGRRRRSPRRGASRAPRPIGAGPGGRSARPRFRPGYPRRAPRRRRCGRRRSRRRRSGSGPGWRSPRRGSQPPRTRGPGRRTRPAGRAGSPGSRWTAQSCERASRPAAGGCPTRAHEPGAATARPPVSPAGEASRPSGSIRAAGRRTGRRRRSPPR